MNVFDFLFVAHDAPTVDELLWYISIRSILSAVNLWLSHSSVYVCQSIRTIAADLKNYHGLYHRPHILELQHFGFVHPFVRWLVFFSLYFNECSCIFWCSCLYVPICVHVYCEFNVSISTIYSRIHRSLKYSRISKQKSN